MSKEKVTEIATACLQALSLTSAWFNRRELKSSNTWNKHDPGQHSDQPQIGFMNWDRALHAQTQHLFQRSHFFGRGVKHQQPCSVLCRPRLLPRVLSEGWNMACLFHLAPPVSELRDSASALVPPHVGLYSQKEACGCKEWSRCGV